MKKDFKALTDARLSGLKVDANLKQRILSDIKHREEPQVKKKLSLSAAIALAIILVTAAAFALTEGFGLFDLMATYMTPEYATVQPEAHDLLKKDLATAEFDHVTVTVKEAVYDGRYLRIVHSTKDKAATAPFDEKTVGELSNGNFVFEAAEKDGVWWSSVDSVEANGQHLNPLGSAGVVAGPGNGETIAWIQYDMSEIDPGDSLEVNIPIRGRQSLEKKELAFTLDMTELPGVYHVREVPEKDFGDYSLKITNFQISPIRVYLDFDLTFKPGVPMEKVEEIMGSWALGEKMTLGDAKGEIVLKPADFGGWGYYQDERLNTEFKMEEGADYGHDVIIDAARPVVGLVLGEYLTQEKYPDTFVLTNGTDVIEIPNLKANLKAE